MEKLKPCPFCGNYCHLKIRDRPGIPAEKTSVFYVTCPCGVHGPAVYPQEDAVKAWNAMPRQSENNDTKFYYVESLDEYWIGRRIDNLYYAVWDGKCFTWRYSKHLPWGEGDLPSEPVEISIDEWVRGLAKKYGALTWQKGTPPEEGWYWHHLPPAFGTVVEFYDPEISGEWHEEWAGPIPYPKD